MPRGGTRANAGRKSGVSIKPEDEQKTKRLVICLTPAQHEEIKNRCETLGVSLSKYIKRKLEIID